MCVCVCVSVCVCVCLCVCVCACVCVCTWKLTIVDFQVISNFVLIQRDTIRLHFHRFLVGSYVYLYEQWTGKQEWEVNS